MANLCRYSEGIASYASADTMIKRPCPLAQRNLLNRMILRTQLKFKSSRASRRPTDHSRMASQIIDNRIVSRKAVSEIS